MWRVVSSLFVASCLAGLGGSAIATAQAPAVSKSPIVLGFERFHNTPATADAAGGFLLLGELNCTSCHAADEKLKDLVEKKQAPILTELGGRAKMDYFTRFLANPQNVKAGTTMPHVFASLSEDEAKANALALAHFLASTGENDPALPGQSAALRGEELFHTIGCVACHGPRKEGVAPIAGSIPLGTPSKKYTYQGMVKFLLNPLHVRPSGRMPQVNLTQQEALDVAAFLLADVAVPGALEVSYYEGSFDKLPDFTKLKEKTRASVEKIDLAVAKRRDNFALRFEGIIQIPKAGEYTFSCLSDDGSRLTVDGKVVVDHDGVHSDSKKEGRAKLEAGRHGFIVEFFEKAGGEVLEVKVKAPQFAEVDLHSLLAPPASAMPTVATPAWQTDASLAAKGQELFQTAGCASCHQLKQKQQTVASKLTAKPLAQLTGQGGCLSETPSGKAPFFALNANQRTALAAALKAIQTPPANLVSAAALAHANLVRLNCYGCHKRGDLGGVEEARDPWFTGTMKEVGDEGRLPPLLTNVGGKLKPEWLKKVLADGEKVRPYVLTRMPKFGSENVGTLAAELTSLDAGSISPAPKVDADDNDRRFKASGRFLVGSQGVGCIKCHTYNGKGTPGIQVMDLTVMTQRLNPDWYHQYMLNPPSLRPGTRMPAAWPNGQSVLPKVLGGDSAKQIRSIWAFMLDGDKGQMPLGLAEAHLELLPIDEPIIYRNFIEGAGPRAIAVGFPQKVNYAWDANHMRLAMIWQGPFIDAAMHWVGRGPGYQKPLGDNVLTFPGEPPLAQLASPAAEWPKTTGRDEKDPQFKFNGYHLDDKRQPTFKYTYQNVVVEDLITPKLDGEILMLQRSLTFTNSGAHENLYFLVASGNDLKLNAQNQTVDISEHGQIRIQSASPAVLQENGSRRDVRIPVKFENGKSKIVLDYEW